ncbi:UvrD-helicase domain-containing protein [Mycoplasma sp. ES3225-GEN-MYC]|uniref:ATP-dependent helicase n=1 Tax=Mycoplasma miroungigenitalium TaxID=754515 RepID=UPI001C108F03|nr:UvrD-helicase domain-containing protein [Mycoplasma miroungigenitalium]MBU4691370.1 UvrD-helicase domain-containing protein [Mycoplasma miroungigenitalium]
MNKTAQILEGLNKEQKEALLYFDGPLRIIAGAGSGKTRVLTRKIAYLINELGIAPAEILALTFTNKAANEMSQRIRQYTTVEPSKIQVSTFHSLCSRILRKEAFHLNLDNDFQIIDAVDQKTIMKRIFSELQLGEIDGAFNSSEILKMISLAKNKNYTADELVHELNEDSPEDQTINEAIGKIFTRYNEYLQNQKSLDFDDLIIKVHNLFVNKPDIAKIWANNYSYIMVDEFQDTSRMQYEIVKRLTSPDTQLTIVGDPDQTIYTWRGADVNLILNFDKDFSNTKTIILNENYRSTQTILDAANSLIKYNKNRFSKDLITNNEKGEPIEYMHAFSNEAEARWVVQTINRLKKQKIQLKNIAIFYRSNYYSRPFEEELIKENINHKIFNGQKFFQRKEIKDALAYLRLIYDGLDLSLLRIINTPARKIGKQTLSNLQKFAESKSLSLYESLNTYVKELPATNEVKMNVARLMSTVNKYRMALKTNAIHLVLEKFLTTIGYFDYLATDVTLKGTGKDNVNELIRSIKNWENNNKGKNIKDYLEFVSLLSAGDDYDNSTNYVTLMTVHSAKGLEFDNIFMVGMSEQIFPHHHALNSSNREHLEEERRLAYVGITRAKQRLFISDSRGYLIGTNTEKEPSRFIAETGLDINKFILQRNIIDTDFNELTDEKSIKDINRSMVVGDIIAHTHFGEGTVLEVRGDTIVVRFVSSNSEKTLSKNHPSIRLLRQEGTN